MTFPDQRHIRVLLLDIEGTTTPIDFVYKTLFPFASSRLEPFLREHSSDGGIQSLLKVLELQNELDRSQGLDPPAFRDDSTEARLTSIVAYAQWLMGRDSKCSPLKSLQGKIWQEGFASGELCGQVYPDVPPAFERWRNQGRRVCIYSSGSVLAQQLLFRTVASGDLTPYIGEFFDTQTGVKTSRDSYVRIAESIGHDPREFLFISDAAKEVEAARTAGMHALLCDRGAPQSALGVPGDTVTTFDGVLPD